jgi:hypothetical protein
MSENRSMQSVYTMDANNGSSYNHSGSYSHGGIGVTNNNNVRYS